MHHLQFYSNDPVNMKAAQDLGQRHGMRVAPVKLYGAVTLYGGAALVDIDSINGDEKLQALAALAEPSVHPRVVFTYDAGNDAVVRLTCHGVRVVGHLEEAFQFLSVTLSPPLRRGIHGRLKNGGKLIARSPERSCVEDSTWRDV